MNYSNKEASINEINKTCAQILRITNQKTVKLKSCFGNKKTTTNLTRPWPFLDDKKSRFRFLSKE